MASHSTSKRELFSESSLWCLASIKTDGNTDFPLNHARKVTLGPSSRTVRFEWGHTPRAEWAQKKKIQRSRPLARSTPSIAMTAAASESSKSRRCRRSLHVKTHSSPRVYNTPRGWEKKQAKKGVHSFTLTRRTAPENQWRHDAAQKILRLSAKSAHHIEWECVWEWSRERERDPFVSY